MRFSTVCRDVPCGLPIPPGCSQGSQALMLLLGVGFAGFSPVTPAHALVSRLPWLAPASSPSAPGLPLPYWGVWSSLGGLPVGTYGVSWAMTGLWAWFPMGTRLPWTLSPRSSILVPFHLTRSLSPGWLRCSRSRLPEAGVLVSRLSLEHVF